MWSFNFFCGPWKELLQCGHFQLRALLQAVFARWNFLSATEVNRALQAPHIRGELGSGVRGGADAIEESMIVVGGGLSGWVDCYEGMAKYGGSKSLNINI